VRHRIFFKLLLAFAIVIAGATLTLDLSVRKAWKDSLTQEIERNLQQKTLMFAERVNSSGNESLQDLVTREGQAAGARATVIDATGKVLADSEATASTMENHAQRPEFVAALQGHLGTSRRSSVTLTIPFLYVAAPTQGGAVRLAYPLSDVEASTALIERQLLRGSALAFPVALIMAGIAAQSISGRLKRIVEFAETIAQGDLTARISESSRDDIGQVARALDKTARNFQKNFEALKTSQRQLETLLNSMQDAVIAVDHEERVLWANQALDRIAPHRVRVQSLVVETIRDPDFLRVVRSATEARTVATSRATSVAPFRIFEVTAAPMPGGGAVAVLRDLTETERVEKTRRDFIANVSHELRTPLTSIQGYTETLLDSASAEDSHSRDFLEIIRKNATRMSRLTEDLLTLARVESGEQRFAMQSVLPEELLREAVLSFRTMAKSQGVEFELHEFALLPVTADVEAIHQVFSNLIDNALKYAGSTGRLVLGSRELANGVEFYVQDFGPGIPSEHLPRLFERFYRVDKARSRDSGGTGLGLAIAKHIVLAHGGTIRAESELNHGSTFIFILPLSTEQVTANSGT
jgi:two-component system phosphate regulon sensor histidine kinase PhoR